MYWKGPTSKNNNNSLISRSEIMLSDNCKKQFVNEPFTPNDISCFLNLCKDSTLTKWKCPSFHYKEEPVRTGIFIKYFDNFVILVLIFVIINEK